MALLQCTCFSGHHCSNGGRLQKAALDCKRVVHVVHSFNRPPHVIIAEEIAHYHLCEQLLVSYVPGPL